MLAVDDGSTALRNEFPHFMQRHIKSYGEIPYIRNGKTELRSHFKLAGPVSVGDRFIASVLFFRWSGDAGPVSVGDRFIADELRLKNLCRVSQPQLAIHTKMVQGIE